MPVKRDQGSGHTPHPFVLFIHAYNYDQYAASHASFHGSITEQHKIKMLQSDEINGQTARYCFGIFSFIVSFHTLPLFNTSYLLHILSKMDSMFDRDFGMDYAPYTSYFLPDRK